LFSIIETVKDGFYPLMIQPGRLIFYGYQEHAEAVAVNLVERFPKFRKRLAITVLPKDAIEEIIALYHIDSVDFVSCGYQRTAEKVSLDEFREMYLSTPDDESTEGDEWKRR
jgi:hypothetical protein